GPVLGERVMLRVNLLPVLIDADVQLHGQLRLAVVERHFVIRDGSLLVALELRLALNASLRAVARVAGSFAWSRGGATGRQADVEGGERAQRNEAITLEGRPHGFLLIRMKGRNANGGPE